MCSSKHVRDYFFERLALSNLATHRAMAKAANLAFFGLLGLAFASPTSLPVVSSLATPFYLGVQPTSPAAAPTLSDHVPVSLSTETPMAFPTGDVDQPITLDAAHLESTGVASWRAFIVSLPRTFANELIRLTPKGLSMTQVGREHRFSMEPKSDRRFYRFFDKLTAQFPKYFLPINMAKPQPRMTAKKVQRLDAFIKNSEENLPALSRFLYVCHLGTKGEVPNEFGVESVEDFAKSLDDEAKLDEHIKFPGLDNMSSRLLDRILQLTLMGQSLYAEFLAMEAEIDERRRNRLIEFLEEDKRRHDALEHDDLLGADGMMASKEGPEFGSEGFTLDLQGATDHVGTMAHGPDKAAAINTGLGSSGHGVNEEHDQPKRFIEAEAGDLIPSNQPETGNVLVDNDGDETDSRNSNPAKINAETANSHNDGEAHVPKNEGNTDRLQDLAPKKKLEEKKSSASPSRYKELMLMQWIFTGLVVRVAGWM